ncbi:hypothetical protein OG352_28805 [Streptomyces sp. NBC_01485]|nr:hypothetical protein [Streptomyces sp. NBC_01485]
MVIKKLLAAAGVVVVLVLGAVGNQHGVERGPVAATPPADNTPWT